MEILVFDDTIENINAAKVAAAANLEHSFTFETSARAALTKLETGEAEGLITDFFAPVDPEMERYWQEYLNPLKIYLKYHESNPDRDLPGFFDKWREERDEWERIMKAMGDMEVWEYIRNDDPKAQFLEIINNEHPFLQEFRGYGGYLMIKAQELVIPSVLVSDIHWHGWKGNPMNGTILLTPLVSACTYTEISDVYRKMHISSGRTRSSKIDPTYWDEAIQKLLAQQSSPTPQEGV